MTVLRTAYVEVLPQTDNFDSELTKRLRRIDASQSGARIGGNFGNAFGSAASERINGLAGKFGPGLLAAFGVGAVTETFRKVIGGASDLNETISKTRQVFGASSDAVLKWSRDSATAIGQSQRAALDGAASFQNLFSQIGIAGDESAKMSTRLVELAGDFASFHNANPAEVMDALLSATRGEYDALQRFVPTVSAAAIETQALADSHKSSTTQLTNAEKATALYHLVIKDAGAATGDFTRTSGGAANQQRIFQAQVENTAASLGQIVLPAYAEFLQTLNQIGPGTILAATGVAVLSNRIAASGADAGVFRDLKAGFQLYSESVAAGAPRIGTALQTAGAATVGLRSAASSVVGLFGGPWGLALTAATVGVGVFTGKMAESRAQADAAVDSFVRFGEAVRAATTDAEIANLIQHNEEIQKLITNANRYGVSGKAVVDALAGEAYANKVVTDALAQRRAELVKTMQAHTIQGGRSGAVMDDQARKAQAEVQQIDKLGDAFTAAEAKQTSSASAQSLYTESAIQARESAAALAREQAASAAQADRLKSGIAVLGASYAPLARIIDTVTDKTQRGKVVSDAYSDALKGLASNAVPPADALTQYGLIADSVGGSQQNAAQKAQTFAGVIQGVGQTATASGPAMDTLARVFNDVATSELSASQKSDLLKQSWQAMYQPAISQTDATEAFNLNLLTLKDSLDKGSLSLDINNAAGIRNRDAVQALIQKNNDLYFANIAAGMSAEEAAKQHDANALEIEKAGTKAGLSKPAIHGLNEEYGKIPPSKNTHITVSGFEDAFKQLIVAKSMQISLDQGRSVEQAKAMANIQVAAAFPNGWPTFAAGGSVPGWSPHDRADNIPAMLTAREWVHPVDAVDYYGPRVMQAIQHRAIPRELFSALGGLSTLRQQISPRVRRPGDGSEGIAFAGGGGVWPFPVTMRNTKIPKPEWSPQVQDAQQWLRAQDGKPYIWAAAGPDGYDCSGIVSAAWNILHGRSPYSHTFSTMSEGAYFPKPGPGLFTAAWSNAGERGGGSVGHTAAKLGGLMFESRGGAGVVVGSGVTPLSSFAHVGHYGRGGLVKQFSMDTGFGVLEPGMNVVNNGTGSTEPITAGPVRLDEYTIGRIVQALSTRPAQVNVDGRAVTDVVSQRLNIAVPGITP